jgi:hypothetical protein
MFVFAFAWGHVAALNTEIKLWDLWDHTFHIVRYVYYLYHHKFKEELSDYQYSTKTLLTKSLGVTWLINFDGGKMDNGYQEL